MSETEFIYNPETALEHPADLSLARCRFCRGIHPTEVTMECQRQGKCVARELDVFEADRKQYIKSQLSFFLSPNLQYFIVLIATIPMLYVAKFAVFTREVHLLYSVFAILAVTTNLLLIHGYFSKKKEKSSQRKFKERNPLYFEMLDSIERHRKRLSES